MEAAGIPVDPGDMEVHGQLGKLLGKELLDLSSQLQGRPVKAAQVRLFVLIEPAAIIIEADAPEKVQGLAAVSGKHGMAPLAMGLTVIIISAADGLVKGRRQVCCSSPRLDAGQIRGRETAAGSPGPFLAKPGKPLQTGDFPNGRVGNRGKLIDLGPPEVYGGADLQDFDKRGAEYMESKKHFGEYICRRRKELGLTQREFADKLYVTESAVSKWERGLSYPDVTLLRDICAVLDVSEHELLTASVDTERRTAERLAEKYLRLTKTYRVAQYILYGATLLGLALPWGLMAWGRYLPGGPWLRGAVCCVWGGIWLWLSPWAVDQIMLANGWNDSQPYEIFWPFTLWGGTPGPVQVMGGIIIALWIAAVALAVVGLRQRIGRR